VEEDYAVDPSLSPLSSLSRAMTTDGSRRRVKSAWTKARRTLPDWSTRKVPAIGSSQEVSPLNTGRSAHTCLCAPRTASSMVKTSPNWRATWLPLSLKSAKVSSSFSAKALLWSGCTGYFVYPFQKRALMMALPVLFLSTIRIR